MEGRVERWAVLGTTLAICIFSGVRFDGPSRGYWDTYITVPAMFMTGQAVDLHRIDGTPRYTYRLTGRIPDDTYDPTPGSFGIASEDQRIGTGILFAAPFALLGLAAFRWGFAAAWAATFLFAYLSLRRLGTGASGRSRPLAAYAASLALVLNPFSLYLERLNGNLFGLAILTFIWFLLTDDEPRWWLIGLVYGILGGIRNEAIILAPMFGAFLWHRSPDARRFLVSFAAFTAAAFLAILPVLLWNRFAYGQMLIHPSQVAHLEGFRPTFRHSFLGLGFQFNGLLNVPFHDHLVRTPHFAFPTFLHWPLVTVKSLGVVLAAIAVVGAGTLARRRPFEAGALAFWYVAVYALFAPQENWEELKQTFMALHLFPLAAFLSAGIKWIAERAMEWRRWTVLAACAAALAGGLAGVRALDFPADDRWYQRFPHAARNESGLPELPESLRKDWQSFYTRETAAEVEREREAMTRIDLLPAMYRPIHLPGADDLARMADEPFQRDLRTLAVWSYIYE